MQVLYELSSGHTFHISVRRRKHVNIIVVIIIIKCEVKFSKSVAWSLISYGYNVYMRVSILSVHTI